MSHGLLRYIKKTPSCKTLVKYTHRDNVHNNQTVTIVIDFKCILDWISVPQFDDLNYEIKESNCICDNLTKLIRGLRHLSVEPVVFLRPQIGSCGDSFSLLLPSLKDAYVKSLSNFSNHTQFSRHDNETINPLLTRQLIRTLVSLEVDIIYTFEESYIWDIYYYMSLYQQENIVGVLSTDIDFLLFPGCNFIDISDFDLSRCLKSFDCHFNSKPSELTFHYVTLESVLKDLNISRTQLIDAVILSGNVYTSHFNSTYKLSSYLKMPETKFAKFENLVEFVRHLNSPIFEREEHLLHVCDSIPLYKRSVSKSYVLYSLPVKEKTPPSLSPVAYWARKRIEANKMSAILYPLTDSGIYWRRPLFESNIVGRVSAHDSLLPIREIIYQLLGIEQVSEFGSTSEKPFDETKIQVLIESPQPEDVLQKILDLELLSLKEKISFLFNVFVNGTSMNKTKDTKNKCTPTNKRDNSKRLKKSHDYLSNIKEDSLMAYSILSLSLYLYGHHVAQNPSEMNGLLEYIITSQILTKCKTDTKRNSTSTSSNTDSSVGPIDKALSISVCFSHLLELVLLLCDILGLNQSLPFPYSLFQTLTAVPFIAKHLSSSFSTDNYDSQFVLVSLPSVKILRSTYLSNEKESICTSTNITNIGDPLQLVYMFNDAVNEVMSEYEKGNISFEIRYSNDNNDDSTITNQKQTDNIKVENIHKDENVESHSIPHECNPLSILGHQKEIIQLMNLYAVLCIVGEAGCGKSSMVPQFILDSSIGKECNIIVAQPRCVGAVGLARRVSEERGEDCGITVGYCVGGGRRCVSMNTQITYCTSGYLLQTLTYHPLRIRKYTHIILDEVHERTTDADFIMLLVRKLVSELTPKTKIILMSATMQGPLFVNYFAEVFSWKRVSAPLFVGIKRCHVDEYFIDELGRLVETTPTCIKDANSEQCKSGKYITCVSQKNGSPLLSSKTSCTQIKPVLTSYVQDLCTELILFCHKNGETILVFLPGINEIMDYHESLSSVLNKRGLKDTIQLFILHSQVSIEEQQAILQSPPLDVSHVILSTNIAESSLTIPMLRVVLNFGLCKVPCYDHKRKMTCLLKSWCSKSATVQRSGRVGRVFEGVAIHLFPKSFYHRSFTDFNPPEMHTTPLGKLLLKARQLGEEMGIVRPSELLKLTLEPPSLFQIEYALRELVFVGAILTDSHFTLSETAHVTILGKFCLSLPFDLDLCRLVFYGLFFGAPVEGIVMATNISLGHDLFSMPSRFLISSLDFYREALSESIDSRVFYDNGKLSDSLQTCFLFKEWFQYFRDSGKSLSKTVSHFCALNSLNYRRFYLFLSIVSSTADQILSFLPQSSHCHRQVHILSLLTRSDYSDIEELSFCENDAVIHALLVATFSGNLVHGVTKTHSDSPNEMKLARLAKDLISYSGFNPHGSLAMCCSRRISENALHYMTSTILQGGKIRTASSAGVGVVEITTPPPHLTKSQALLFLWQFCERRLHWKLEGTEITFTLPFSPYEIIWSRLFEQKEKVYMSIWRNMTGFITEFSEFPPPLLGVVTSLQGGETSQSRGRGLTVLPSLKNSKVSLLFILAFQCFHASIELRTNTNTVTAFRINSTELDFQKWQSLTCQDLININLLRADLTQVLHSTELSGNCLPLLLMDSVRNKLNQLILGNSKTDITESPKLDFYIEGVQEFYPQLKCSILEKENQDNSSSNNNSVHCENSSVEKKESTLESKSEQQKVLLKQENKTEQEKKSSRQKMTSTNVTTTISVTTITDTNVTDTNIPDTNVTDTTITDTTITDTTITDTTITDTNVSDTNVTSTKQRRGRYSTTGERRSSSSFEEEPHVEKKENNLQETKSNNVIFNDRLQCEQQKVSLKQEVKTKHKKKSSRQKMTSTTNTSSVTSTDVRSNFVALDCSEVASHSLFLKEKENLEVATNTCSITGQNIVERNKDKDCHCEQESVDYNESEVYCKQKDKSLVNQKDDNTFIDDCKSDSKERNLQQCDINHININNNNNKQYIEDKDIHKEEVKTKESIHDTEDKEEYKREEKNNCDGNMLDIDKEEKEISSEVKHNIDTSEDTTLPSSPSFLTLNPLADSFVPIALSPSYKPRLQINGSSSGNGLLQSPPCLLSPGFRQLPPGFSQLPPGRPQLPPGLHQFPPGLHQLPPEFHQLPPGFHQLPPGFSQLPPGLSPLRQPHLRNQHVPPAHLLSQSNRSHPLSPSNMPHLSFRQISNDPTIQLSHLPVGEASNLPHPPSNQMPHPSTDTPINLTFTDRPPLIRNLPPGFSLNDIPLHANTRTDICHLLETIIINIIAKTDEKQLRYSKLLKDKRIKEFLLSLNVTLPIEFFALRSKIFKIKICYDITVAGKDIPDYMISCNDQ